MYCNHVSTLFPGSAELLVQLGCWDAVLAACVAPITNMLVWNGFIPARISFRSSPGLTPA